MRLRGTHGVCEELWVLYGSVRPMGRYGVYKVLWAPSGLWVL